MDAKPTSQKLIRKLKKLTKAEKTLDCANGLRGPRSQRSFRGWRQRAACLGRTSATIRVEMAPLHAALVAKERAVEDARDAAVAAQAVEDHHEINFENLLRDIDADLGKLDRADATLQARVTVFPDGFGKEIEPEGDAQLDVVPDLRTRVAKFSSHSVIADALTRFDTLVNALKNAVSTTNAAEDNVDHLATQEDDARRAIREQLDKAYGQLRALYKSAPGKAEAFFLREGSRRPAKSG